MNLKQSTQANTMPHQHFLQENPNTLKELGFTTHTLINNAQNFLFAHTKTTFEQKKRLII